MLYMLSHFPVAELRNHGSLYKYSTTPSDFLRRNTQDMPMSSSAKEGGSNPKPKLETNEYHYLYDPVEDRHTIVFKYESENANPNIRFFAGDFHPNDDMTGSTCLSSEHATELNLWPAGIIGETDFSKRGEARVHFQFDDERIETMFKHFGNNFFQHQKIAPMYQLLDSEATFVVQFCLLFSLSINQIEMSVKEVEVRSNPSSPTVSLELEGGFEIAKKKIEPLLAEQHIGVIAYMCDEIGNNVNQIRIGQATAICLETTEPTTSYIQGIETFLFHAKDGDELIFQHLFSQGSPVGLTKVLESGGANFVFQFYLYSGFYHTATIRGEGVHGSGQAILGLSSKEKGDKHRRIEAGSNEVQFELDFDILPPSNDEKGVYVVASMPGSSCGVRASVFSHLLLFGFICLKLLL